MVEDALTAERARFGVELRRWRARRGLSLLALSRRVHYSKGYLSKIENAVKPVTVDLARRCDEALGAGGALVALASATYRAPASGVCGVGAAASGSGGCPYRGLAAFGERDAEWFFGRERATAALAGRLAERIGRGPLAVVGASGAGKSSLLRAGLLPALGRGALPAAGSAGWPVVTFTPTGQPLAELTRALSAALGAGFPLGAARLRAQPAALGPALRAAGGGGRVVLVVDQFEELFTLCLDGREAGAFVRALCLAARDAPDGGAAPAVVALGLRADFCGRLLGFPELAEVLTDGLFAVRPMSVAELRASITRPARRAGLTLEPGLVELLLRDIGEGGRGGLAQEGDPDGGSGASAGALPLLSHALLATWQQRSGRTLTVAGYEMTGGIHGAVARTAENAFGGLDERRRQVARGLLTWLAQPSPDGEPLRRRMAREALLERLGDPLAAEVLDVFTRARLVTADRDTVTITHEALLWAWPRLRGWLQADQADLMLRQRLADAAASWEQAGRDAAALYRGARLAAALEWARAPRRRATLTAAERAFLDAAVAEERARAQAAARHARQQRRLLAVFAVLLMAAVAAGVLAYAQRGAAYRQRLLAQADAMAARSAALAAGDPEASMLLARAALRVARTTDATSALLSAQAQYFDGRLRGHTGPVNAVTFSPDGRWLATASTDGTAKLWRVGERGAAATLAAGGGPLRAVAFSPDGRTLATASQTAGVTLWDVGSRAAAARLPTGGAARAVAFSPDGRTLAVGDERGTVTLWGLAAGRAPSVRASLAAHEQGVNAVAFSPDGSLVASGGLDHTARLWDAASGSLVATLAGHSDVVLAVAFSPDGRTVATGSADRTVRLWAAPGGQPQATLVGHSDDVNALAYTPDGRTLVSASGDGAARLWDTATTRMTGALSGHTDYVMGVAVSRDGLVATGGFDGSAVLWDLRRSTLAAHPYAEVWKSAFSPGGALLASAAGDHTVRLWDVAGRRQVASLAGHSGSVFSVAFSPDGRLLASASADHTVRLWDVAARRQVATLDGHSGSVFSVAFSPDGRLLASASADHTVRLWDVAARTPVATLTGHQDYVNAVAFSPDGRWLATGSDDMSVRLWDVAGRRQIATLTGHAGAVEGVAFDPAGALLASCGNDGTVRLWDVAGRRQVSVLTGHVGSVRGVAFSPDGRLLASSGNDRTVRLWDVGAARPAATLAGHASAVWGVAFGRDGRLASSSDDGTVRLWNVDVDAQSAAICHLVGPVDRRRWGQLLPREPYQRVCGA